MKQVFRRVIDRRGRVMIAELPVPHVGPEQVLVQSQYSLISSGTEMGTLAKTPAELVKQTISDPWMRHVVQADRAGHGYEPDRPAGLARDDHPSRDRLQRGRHGAGPG